MCFIVGPLIFFSSHNVYFGHFFHYHFKCDVNVKPGHVTSQDYILQSRRVQDALYD